MIKNSNNETAGKQGNGKVDRELPQAIRKSVIADSTLSMNAHNVKQQIAKLATAAGAKQIDNQIEISPPK